MWPGEKKLSTALQITVEKFRVGHNFVSENSVYKEKREKVWRQRQGEGMREKKTVYLPCAGVFYSQYR